MSNYKSDVVSQAKNFLSDNEEILRESIIDRNDSFDDHRNFSDLIHEQITDRSYSVKDAAVIIDECENEETDTGLWETLSPEDALVSKAAYSFSNDVRSEIQDQYKNLKELYDEKLEELETEKEEIETLQDRSSEGEELDEEENLKLSNFRDQRELIEAEYNAFNSHREAGLEMSYVERTKLNELELLKGDDLEKIAFMQAWEEFTHEEEAKIGLIEPGSENEKYAIKRWFSLGEKAGMFSGYPMGGSYIDTRVGSGHGIPDIKDYVDYDHLIAAQLPHLSGKYSGDVKTYYNEQFGREEKIAELVKAMQLIKDSPEALEALALETHQYDESTPGNLKAAFSNAQMALPNYFKPESEGFKAKEPAKENDAVNFPEGFKNIMKEMLSPDAKKDQDPDREDDLERD